MCNNYCFSAATVVARTRPGVTLYVNFPSCSKYKAHRNEINGTQPTKNTQAKPKKIYIVKHETAFKQKES